MQTITGNTFPVKDQLKALGGRWNSVAKGWDIPDHAAEAALALVASVAPKPASATVQVGDIAGIITLFDRAKKHLKAPAIVLQGPAGWLRINVAGEQARVPGSLNVTDYDQRQDDGRRVWYGRITRDGAFSPSRDADASILPYLARFAADPAKVAGEHGRLTGRCCFCNRPLSDERSTAVGYGGTCADRYGLPWGEVAHTFDAPAQLALTA